MSDSDSDSSDEQQQVPYKDENEGLHPLFWDTIPANADSCPEFEALKAIDDELTPFERADGLKVRVCVLKPLHFGL